MVRKILLTCGILSSLSYVSANVFGALAWKGYDSVSQPVSELGAIGAPSQPLMLAIGTLYGILTLAFGLGVWGAAEGKRTLRVVAVLLVGYAVACLSAPLTPIHQRGVAWTLTDTLHIVFTVVDVLFILLIIVFGALSFGKGFRMYSIGTILVGIVSGTLLGLDALHFGLWERINIYAFLLWIIVFAVTLWRADSEQEQMPDGRPQISRKLSVHP